MERTLFNAKRVEDVEFCLNRGDNIETRMSHSGETPFIHHCQKGNTDVVMELIKRGCDVNIRHAFNMSGLDYVCRKGHYDLLVRLLTIPQIKDQINPIGLKSPLFYCLYKGRCDIFDVLVENGADVNHKYPHGITTLRTAMSYRHPVLVRKLLDIGADVYDVDENGRTCIHTYDITLECLDIVLCYGGLALINKQDNVTATPLLMAVHCVNIEIIPRLLECGADPNLANHSGITPLEYAKTLPGKTFCSIDKINAVINLLK